MSRRLFAFLLAELRTVRVICPRPQCGAVTEVSMERLATQFPNSRPACPACGVEFAGLCNNNGVKSPLARLADAILEIQGAGKPNPPEVQIEFVLPDPA